MQQSTQSNTDSYRPQYKKPDLYPTFEEASAAVKRLGIKTMEEYQFRRSADPRLPAIPTRSYDDYHIKGGAKAFLGRNRQQIPLEYYQSYEEAQKAAIALSIKTFGDYVAQHEKDPKLPKDPTSIYRTFMMRGGWRTFLSGPKKPKKYPTVLEARQACHKLGIKSWSEYSTRYKEDPRLPAKPFEKYLDLKELGGASYLLVTPASNPNAPRVKYKLSGIGNDRPSKPLKNRPTLCFNNLHTCLRKQASDF